MDSIVTTFPEKDAQQEADLEVYFLIRSKGISELQARQIISFRQMNNMIGHWYEEMYEILYPYEDVIQ